MDKKYSYKSPLVYLVEPILGYYIMMAGIILLEVFRSMTV